MKAARFIGPGKDLEVLTVEKPVPQAGQALVRVRAVGLCGSDVHIAEGHTPTAFAPITLGHEIAGIVECFGPGVSSSEVAIGDRVFVNPLVGCGECRQCKAGQANFCADRQVIGIHRNGALAEYVVVPIRNLIRLPRSVDFAEIALIESAGTANQAVRVLDVGKDDVIVVIGAGGLGMQAVRIALAQGAQVYAVDTDAAALARCREAGASGAFNANSGSLVKDILHAAGRPHGLDGVIDCVGIPSTFKVALEILRRNGHCALIGIGSDALALPPPASFMRRALRVSGIYGYTDEDIHQVIARLLDGSLDLRKSISVRLPLDKVNDGLRLFSDRTNSPIRVVIEP